MKDTYRYKPHDEVCLVDGLKPNTRYYMRSGFKEGSASVAYSEYGMRNLLNQYGNGRVLHIRKRELGYYRIEEDDGYQKWTDEMFRPVDGISFQSLL